jgi:hypothetical protein
VVPVRVGCKLGVLVFGGCFCTLVFLFLLVNAMIHSPPVYSCVCVGVGVGGACMLQQEFFSFVYKQFLYSIAS